jgi:hypothetical protein
VLLVARNGSALYTPDSIPTPQDAWRPTISSLNGFLADGWTRLSVYLSESNSLAGTLFTGWSFAVNHAATESTATNYPLVQIRQGSSRVYCRTFGHNQMGIGPEMSASGTSFEAPRGVLALGPADLVIIVNGIESVIVPIDITETPPPLRRPDEDRPWQQVLGNLADGPLFVIGADGHIRRVPPRGPDTYRPEVNAALQEIAEGVSALETAGVMKTASREELFAQTDGPTASSQAGPARSRSGRTAALVTVFLANLCLLVAVGLEFAVPSSTGGVTPAVGVSSGLGLGLTLVGLIMSLNTGARGQQVMR